MAVTDYADFKKKTEAQQFNFVWTTNASGAGRWMQSWRTAPSSGSVPATYRSCESTTPGNLMQWDAAINRGTTLYLAEVSQSGNTQAAFSGLLVDRLADQTGLVLNVASSQVTNLPLTPTRFTDGEGVHAALTCWASAANSTALTGTILYTNQAGTTGHVSKAFPISSAYGTDTMTMITLADADTGIRQIQAFTVSASVSAAGVFGLILFKPLAIINLSNSWPSPNAVEGYTNMLVGGGGNLAPMPSSGCLDMFMYNAPSATALVVGRTNWIEA